MGWILLIIALTLNATANILMKLGSARLEKAEHALATDASLLEKGLAYATNPYLVCGIVLFGMNVLFYIAAIKKINLSIAYPIMMSGGVLIITLFSIIQLKEYLNAFQFAGIALITIGMVLVTYFAEAQG